MIAIPMNIANIGRGQTSSDGLEAALARRTHIVESVLGTRLLRPSETEDQTCAVDRIVDDGLTVQEARDRIRYASDIVIGGVGLADLVLRTRRGRYVSLLLPPDVAVHLRNGSRFLRIDAFRRAQMLHEGYIPSLQAGSPQVLERVARRALIERTTGLELSDASEFGRLLDDGVVRARYIRSVDAGAVIPIASGPWSVSANGRHLGDVVVRLAENRYGALLLDPEEAEALRRHRYGPAIIRLDCSRRADVL